MQNKETEWVHKEFSSKPGRCWSCVFGNVPGGDDEISNSNRFDCPKSRCTWIKCPLAEMCPGDISAQSKAWDEISPSVLKCAPGTFQPSRKPGMKCPRLGLNVPGNAVAQKQRFIPNSVKHMTTYFLTLSLPRVINFKFLLQPHQKYYITQYEELGFSSFTLMTNDYTANAHYTTRTSLYKKVGRMYFLVLGVKGLKAARRNIRSIMSPSRFHVVGRVPSRASRPGVCYGYSEWTECIR